jgi:sugar phosphate isomerase/epimerase
MRLGATIDQYGTFDDPQDYVSECVRCHYRSASAPKVTIHEPEKIREVRERFAAADLMIAEVHAWVNPLDPRPALRRRNLNTIAESLVTADELGAVCCVTVAGTYDTSENAECDSPHRDNFKESTFDAIVEWIRGVLSEVKPRRAKLTLEISPWTFLDGPEAYRRIIDAVDHSGLAVHLDPTNAVRDAHLFYSVTELLDRCFDLLGQWIVSCHAKDISQGPYLNQVNLVEVTPGNGVLDYCTFLRRIEQISPETPLVIEHLKTREEYGAAADFIRSVANEVGATA